MAKFYAIKIFSDRHGNNLLRCANTAMKDPLQIYYEKTCFCQVK
ncbi:hypothetical protein HMPREF9370_1433 [Neisseria wadsworthii 9715]|uniref:Uncharacterized protein n=1 Tax=Neisseria wadsworthii 9715 TaxID=1030841 RepID=G4CQS3_9NEIS|nr:hypothetical protein HMPREF9370_1433 [Neisseria wadsworthii 9715]